MLTPDQVIESCLAFAILIAGLVAVVIHNDAKELRLDVSYEHDRSSAIRQSAKALRGLVTNHLEGGKGHLPMSKVLRKDLDLACGDVEVALSAYEDTSLDAALEPGDTYGGPNETRH